MVVRAAPPAELAAVYRGLASRHRGLQGVLRDAAEGGFGSGFVLALRGQDVGSSQVKPFVVTNHHVVGLATRTSILRPGSEHPLDAEVVYVDPTYDIAVLAPVTRSPLPEGWPRTGLDVTTLPAKDQQAVVASGYPGLGNKPSYQVTRGYVSNERFLLDDGRGERLYVQHTAPIDPGSSGGPLTNEGGKLIGVNTLKARQRENVGLAVPATAVAAAVEKAAGATESSVSARAACEEIVAALGQGQKGVATAEHAVGVALAATEGVASLGYLPSDDDEWAEAFLYDPTRVLVHALALRMLATIPPADSRGGSAATCVPSNDAPTVLTVVTKSGPRTWTFAREQGRYKLVSAGLAPAKGESPLQPKPTKKWSPSMR